MRLRTKRLSAPGITIIPVAALIVAAVVVAVIDVPGCSLFMPKFTTPELSIVGIEIGRSNLFTQHLDVRMRVDNPNDRELPVQGLSYQLFVEGEEVARGVSEASFTVPPLGEAEFDMQVTANLAGALLTLLSQTGARSGVVQYRIVGKVELSRGLLRSIPFEQHGSVTLK
jgi:LEA14-like dessication related protein